MVGAVIFPTSKPPDLATKRPNLFFLFDAPAMMKIILPVLIVALCAGVGFGAGKFLKPAEDVEAEQDQEEETVEMEEEEPIGPVEFLDMPNQFVIPIIKDGDVTSIAVLSLGLEVAEGTIASVNSLRPKLRDTFLQILFNFGNNGGFDGNFTEFYHVEALKQELLRNAHVISGPNVVDVLILDYLRQDP